MAFLAGYHHDVWEALGRAVPASDLDREGMSFDAEHVVPATFAVLGVVEDDDGTIMVDVEWQPTRPTSLEALDVDVYGYLARLSYSDVMIARRVTPPEVVYVVATSTADGQLGQRLMVWVGGPAVQGLVGTGPT